MADVTWGAGVAVGIQTDQTTLNATIRDLGSSLGVSDGIVLGVATAGTGETGITIPTLTRDFLEKPDVAGTLTKTVNTFLKTKADSFQISFELKGNGAAATPSVGEGKPDSGIDVLLSVAGLDGANGDSAGEYDYTPQTGDTEYATIKLWVAGQSFTFGGCLVDTLTLPFVGGQAVIAVANIRVGWLDTGAGTTEVALPTFTYGTQASLSAPVLEGAGYFWGYTRSAQNMEVTIANDVLEIEDMNVDDTGIRLSQNGRTISVNGTVYQDSANDDFEYTELIDTDGTLSSASWRLGTQAGAAETLNSVAISATTLQVTSMKPVDAGDVTAIEVQSHCTGTTGGSEFKLTFD